MTSASSDRKVQEKLFNVIIIINRFIGCPGKDLSIALAELPKAHYIKGAQVILESREGTAKA